jgi:hypothetical protein
MLATPASERAHPTGPNSGLVSKVRTVGSDFKVKIFTKKFSFEFFWPWGGFLNFGHCLVKRDIEYSTCSCTNECRVSV